MRTTCAKWGWRCILAQYKVFPYGVVGQPVISKRWRGHTALAQLLPFVEQAGAATQIDWNAPLNDGVNEPATSTQPPVFVCPSDSTYGRHLLTNFAQNPGWARSNFAACFGSETMLADDHGISIVIESDWTGVDLRTDGAFQIDAARSIAAFRDGVSQTIVASEVLTGRDDSSLMPGDSDCDVRGVWSHFLMGASSYTHYNTPNSGSSDSLPTGGIGRNWCVDQPDQGLPCNLHASGSYDSFHAAARSRHPGGVQVLFGDGHLTFINDAVDHTLWKRLAAIADGQVIDPSSL